MRLGTSLFVAALAALLLDPKSSGADLDEIEAAIRSIEAAAPSGWKVLRTTHGEVPWGHSWGRDYSGPRGTSIILVGPTDVLFRWSDSNGEWHREPLAKESIHLWIMPPQYRNSFWSFLDIHRPIQPQLLFKGRKYRVYARLSHEISSEIRFRELLGKATSTGWPDSPSETGIVSWPDWKSDLESALQESDRT